jgi:AcrR family transcriptional regulator
VTKTRLTPSDWATAALEAIADGGVAAVIVEALAPRVGASKGSFYWHFQDRSALLEAALEMWETARTEAIVAELQDVEDPLERLRRLLGIAFNNPHGGRIEAALNAQPAHPQVAPVLERVTERRIGFIAEAFGDLGFGAEDARHRALIFYTTVLGFFSMMQGQPHVVPRSGPELESYAETLLQILTSR